MSLSNPSKSTVRRSSANRKKKKKLDSHARRRAFATLARVRKHGGSVTKAARLEGTTLRVVRKYLGKQIKRNASGHYVATRSDTLRRDLNVLGYDGYEEVVVRSSKQAQVASDHLIAVNRFLRTGDEEWLKPYLGKRVGGIELLTDPTRLYEMAKADLFKLDSLYRQNRGAK